MFNNAPRGKVYRNAAGCANQKIDPMCRNLAGYAPIWRSASDCVFSPLIPMSNLHPSTAPHIRRAVERRERRAAFARVSMFASSSALFAAVALASVNPAKESNPAAIAALMFGVMTYALIDTFRDTELPRESVTNAAAVSDSIFADYIVPFEAVSVLLLAALIGAVVVARKE